MRHGVQQITLRQENARVSIGGMTNDQVTMIEFKQATTDELLTNEQTETHNMKNLMSHSGFIDDYDTDGNRNLPNREEGRSSDINSKLEHYQSRLYESLQQSNELTQNIIAY